MNIKLIRLRNGELLLGEVEIVSSTSVRIKNPMGITMTGPSQLALIPWMQIANFDRKQGIIFSNDKIDYDLPPVDSIRQEYVKSVTGIQVITPDMVENTPQNGVTPEEMMGNLRLSQ